MNKIFTSEFVPNRSRLNFRKCISERNFVIKIFQTGRTKIWAKKLLICVKGRNRTDSKRLPSPPKRALISLSVCEERFSHERERTLRSKIFLHKKNNHSYFFRPQTKELNLYGYDYLLTKNRQLAV